ncbi:hypothetical protein LT679_11035 [Mucilaginibacter roseus]|uniref:TFIIB-type zinc ribbon-containing protein n=1 Tax=Mucilaginibacter roseus TaxID=1528868 RepID=A0ABS8U5M8_9SPHI|nr:hypothetical protein [Mucilaginibacter roseus]MCD8741137.1 hypothetical protein [Mucilaginibacter roseus]
MPAESPQTSEVISLLKCKSCGASTRFLPGSNKLRCDHCGSEEEIEVSSEPVISLDYELYITETQALYQTPVLHAVKCSGCGSETILEQSVTADRCPFCASPLVVSTTNQGMVKPHYILPFKIDTKAAVGFFNKWLKGLWFAPSDLAKKVNANVSALKGVYMPFWTYDTDTVTQYQGQRGDHYYVTETYTTTVNGQQQTQTRQVRKTRWSYASGTVSRDYRDVLVPSSKSLPQDTLLELEPWDLRMLANFDERYLSGFRSENFQTTPQVGLETAKQLIEPKILSDVRNDIGGDEQRIDSHATSYYNIGIKYIMLPVWVSAYSYNNKVYQFTVNARTGEVIGKRPYSAIKITLFVLMILAIIVLIILYFSNQQA